MENDIASRITHRRESIGLSQTDIASALDITPQAVQQWESGKTTPRGKRMEKLAAQLRTTPQWLQYGTGFIEDTNHRLSFYDDQPSDIVEIPIYNAQLAAGSGVWATDENIIGTMSFPRSWITANGLPMAGLAIAEASGDSMHPSIKDGDTLLIDTNQKKPSSGQVFAFANGDAELRVKRLSKRMDGMWVIRSDNSDPAYMDETISPQDVQTLHIIGRVVKVIGNI
ncbi:MAG: helix-turn-helix domain-containing protein [Motiliproteus sp.]|nr:helix-turn-helix domain-containing protein [Motiliproteus sp.]MCW9051260.1 helix-turn-helix domain-containing protein [Motiliproteus sp.]